MTSQLDIRFARVARDKGIDRAVKHADEVHTDWQQKAYEHFLTFIRVTPWPFLMEEYRQWSEGLVPTPPSLRAFGAIAQKAVRAGLIKRVGFNQVTNVRAHRANASLWERVK